MFRFFGFVGLYRGLAIMLLATMAGLPAQAQSLGKVGPHQGSDALIAARETEPHEALKITVKHQRGPFQSPEREEILLGDGYIQVTRTDAVTLYDLRLKRVLRYAPEGETYRNDSLFAAVAEKRVRFDRMLAARANRNASTTQGKAGRPTPKEIFEVAAETGFLRDKMAKRAPGLTIREDGESVRAEVLGREVATLDFADTPAKEMHRRLLRRYLGYELPLYPALAKAISERKSLPREISYRHHWDESPVSGQWRVMAAETVTTAYPLKPGLRADANTMPPPYRQVRPHLVKEVGEPKRSKKAPDETVKTAQAAAARGDWVAVYLAASTTAVPYYMDCNSKAAKDGCRRLVSLRQQAMREAPDAALIRKAFYNPPKKADALLELIDDVKGVARSVSPDTPYVYRLSLGLARLGWALRQAPDATPEDVAASSLDLDTLFATALRANPRNANIYRDYGDYHFLSLRAYEGWRIYDLGRAIIPHGRLVRLSNINDAEEGFRRTYPEYF